MAALHPFDRANPTLHISAPALRRALAAGMRRVVARREALNAINVFPVPDGDTGSNLAFTVSSVLAGSLSRRARGAGELLRHVAADALDGARGNSGAILAQFLHGVGESAGAARTLSADGLALSVRAGAEQASAAVAQPREGTILSVIRRFADALALAQRRNGVADWFREALKQTQQALADTPNQLPVLRQAGVVDAGAQGFVDLLEGIESYIESGQSESADEPGGAFAGTELHEDVDFSRPFCSECVLEGKALDRNALRTALAALDADSVVIAGGNEKLRVHAHVAAPGRLFETVGGFGRISARKAEDMRLQHRSASTSDRIAVVTDSGADVPADLAAALNLSMVPARVSFGGDDFLDKVSLSPGEFYQRLRVGGELPKTSQPPPGDFRRQFEFLLAHHPGLVYVGISRALSGTLQSGEAVAARLDAQRICVIDSGQATCAEGLLALAAAELAAEGASIEMIRQRIEWLKPRAVTMAMARDIRYAVRGGRIPRWAGLIASVLGATPIARMNAHGLLRPAGALFGRRDLPARFARWVSRRLPSESAWRLMVGHCDCAADGEALQQRLTELLPVRSSWLVEAGPAVGAHAGPGALVVGLLPVYDLSRY